MKQKYSKKISSELLVAKEHIESLFKQASIADDQTLSDRYIKLARDIAKKFKIRLKSQYKRQFCKYCGAFFRIGVNCRVRLYRSKIVYFCQKCRHFYRIPYK